MNSNLSVFKQVIASLVLAILVSIASVSTAEARFLTPDTWDPWLAGVDVNRYAYGLNDPINQSDPNGHDTFASGAPYNGTYICSGGACVGVDGSLFQGFDPLTTPDDEWQRALRMTPKERSLFFEETTNRRERQRVAAEKAADSVLGILARGKLKKSIGIDPSKGPKIGPRKPTKSTRDNADEEATDKTGKLRCKYCKEEMTKDAGSKNSREYDHRDPYSKGGSRDPTNIDSICRSCNRGKGSKSVGDFLRSLWRKSDRK
jgi:hypothetical protein